MPDIADDKLPLTTPDLTAGLLAHLHEVAPQVFCEGKVDFDKLKAALGATLEESPERYGLSWAGKSEAFRNVQIPSVATLLPQPAESVAWDTTENQIIEGDNLEVLKLLQKSYHGKIKMIYIDPPYNTGNEFIYPDNYREGLKDYLRYSGQVSEEGIKQSTNTETGGRFHSNWLSMMYPRLFLARNLLREDGVIFVSIDDNEVHNLRMLMNEVFGEENFVVQITWKSRKYPDSRAKTGVSTDHEYILVYCRSEVKLRGIERDETKFSNPDDDSRGVWMSRSLLGLANKDQRPNLHYIITDPESGNDYSPPADTGWRYSKERMHQLIENKCILFPTKPDGRPREKKFRDDMQTNLIAFPSVIDDTFTADGTADIRSFFGSQVFDFSKPSSLLKKLIAQGTDDASLVLDFFAGSGTTAQAVMELNREDNGNRKFILVQLPEPIPLPTSPLKGEEQKAFSTIADITRERVRRVIQKISRGDAENTEKKSKEPGLPFSADSAPPRETDLGFRAFKLSSSNFKIWDADHAPATSDALAEQLKLYADNIEQLRDQQDILYELILKTGKPLSSRIECLDIAGIPVYSVSEGQLLICLENPITKEILQGMMERKPLQILSLDTAFGGDDALKTNTVLEAKSHGIVFRTA